MNAKQSLKLVSKRLEDLEIILARAQNDIRDYNLCIDSMIKGGSPCDWCEEQAECQLTAKDEGKGCAEWWLRYKEENDEAQVGNQGEDEDTGIVGGFS